MQTTVCRKCKVAHGILADGALTNSHTSIVALQLSVAGFEGFIQAFRADHQG